MRTPRPRRINRDTAEQLLSGAPVGRRGGADPFAERLSELAVPAFPGELAGEGAAVAAFQAAAHLDPVTRPRRSSMLKSTLAKILTLKAAAVLAVTAAGGVALAASTGTLPDLLDHSPSSSASAAHATGKPSAKPADKGTGPGGASGSPSPNLDGLCHAYLAGAGADHGKALEDPAFTVLITTAGGKDKVDAYCSAVVANPPGNAPTSHPSPTVARRCRGSV